MLIILEYLPEYANVCILFIYIRPESVHWDTKWKQETVLYLFLKPNCSQPLQVAHDVGIGTSVFILMRYFENPVLLFWTFWSMN